VNVRRTSNREYDFPLQERIVPAAIFDCLRVFPQEVSLEEIQIQVRMRPPEPEGAQEYAQKFNKSLETVTHWSFRCDSCSQSPIRGERFQCAGDDEMPHCNFDLCGACFRNGSNTIYIGAPRHTVKEHSKFFYLHRSIQTLANVVRLPTNEEVESNNLRIQRLAIPNRTRLYF